MNHSRLAWGPERVDDLRISSYVRPADQIHAVRDSGEDVVQNLTNRPRGSWQIDH